MKCSFCGNKNTEVEKFVAANDKLGICDICIKLAYKTITDGPIVKKIYIKGDCHHDKTKD